MSANENISPRTLGRISKQIVALMSDPPPGVKVVPHESDLRQIEAWIDGPEGTPYEAGKFQVRLVFNSDFPQSPPRGYFATKIFHPNVASNGEICVNTLKQDWDPTLGIGHVFTVIRCLLINPNPESALNDEAGKLLMEDYDQFANRARMITQIHARSPPVCKKIASFPSSSASSIQQKTVETTTTITAASSGKVTTVTPDTSPVSKKGLVSSPGTPVTPDSSKGKRSPSSSTASSKSKRKKYKSGLKRL